VTVVENTLMKHPRKTLTITNTLREDVRGDERDNDVRVRLEKQQVSAAALFHNLERRMLSFRSRNKFVQ